MNRPPRLIILLAVCLIALATAGGAAMSAFRRPIQRYATERILAAREVHNLSGAREYDIEVVNEIVFTIEAGLSFFHTHGEGMGVVLLFASTVVSTLVPRRWLRGSLNALIGLSFLFPIGYLAGSFFILFYGKDAGSALAEQTLLIPFGSSAILGLALAAAAAVVSLVAGPRGAAPARGDAWRLPPRAVVFAAALLIFLAEVGGASMGRWTREINAFARASILGGGAAHGLVGIRDVDDEIADEAVVKLDAGLRLFHLHGEGMGLVIFAGGLVVATLVTAPRWRTLLYVLLTGGGFGFPFGYLLWSALIPRLGVDRARGIAEAWLLIPFGSAALGAVSLLAVLVARDLLRALPWRGAPAAPAENQPPRLPLPPVSLILCSMALLLVAEAGGAAMVKFKSEIERANRQRVEARSGVHGLVGVRQVDGDTVDRILARADFALRLFHLHAEGMGLVIFAGGLMIRAFVGSPSISRVLYAMLTVGGFLYPFGYLVWSLMIPDLGLDRSKDLAESLVWMPFGGALLVAIGGLTALLPFGRLARDREPRRKA